MKPKLIFLTAVTIIVFAGLLIIKNKNQSKTTVPAAQTKEPQVASSPTIVDISAVFAIYTKGTFRIFTASKYHNLSDDVFIESANPNVVHVKKEGTTWGDFFKTLPMKLSAECLTTGTGQTFCSGEGGSLKFYINGQKVENFLEREINQNDKALITYGSEGDFEIKKQLEKADSIL
ncbi:hypothetical protein A3D81_01540 [Candidatus Curtissbacteria bacterium RIFCSPHIGHO2_02_FULL_40_17]|uniref:Uncharacterized protein n=3 Tax=Candidatus Curtissiibacteriota TaxID=1752717 RepID=A0A1F5GIU7_9BACT|nr:MAG: hypothetical protein A3D81_01540 [Candidatus Curtissbacteria bacterium RIFCSPHIGHO2_02_FULL_40_17]OGE03365.1 MAG: hypothetical protein A3F45_03660 [Candidatus Curtissbacteria bacterium RIFCSPHIGHO2_12_FULL_41_17]OGE06508.1 MAG: hypothetical protein A3I53_01840 [Candidatus Curtissbacteria bacterium RIFCSPLOWO2_02_FULL_40_13b]